MAHPGVAVVRAVLENLELVFEETDMGDDVVRFAVDTGDDDVLLAGALATHQPGSFVFHIVSRAEFEEKHVPSLFAYAAAVNAFDPHVTLEVEPPRPDQAGVIMIRASVNYARIDVLEEGYVASAIGAAIEGSERWFAGIEPVLDGEDPFEVAEAYADYTDDEDGSSPEVDAKNLN